MDPFFVLQEIRDPRFNNAREVALRTEMFGRITGVTVKSDSQAYLYIVAWLNKRDLPLSSVLKKENLSLEKEVTKYFSLDMTDPIQVKALNGVCKRLRGVLNAFK